jgi:hypothetical protein
MATAKKKPAKADATYGLKKDGTPKKKPGVKTGSVRQAYAAMRKAYPQDLQNVVIMPEPGPSFGRLMPDAHTAAALERLRNAEPIKRISEIDDQMGRLGAVVVDIERTASDLAQALSAIVHPTTVAAATDTPEEAPAGSGLGCSIMEFRSRLQRAVASIRATIDSLAL